MLNEKTLTSIPAEDISSPEVAAAVTTAVGQADPVVTIVDFLVGRRVDAVLDICPLGQISSFRLGRTAAGAYSTDLHSGSLE